jgi:hypothetical protein
VGGFGESFTLFLKDFVLLCELNPQRQTNKTKMKKIKVKRWLLSL